MSDECSHLDQIVLGVSPGGDGCQECLETDQTWLHLRRCAVCGHIGCCDSSPNKHARRHFEETGHAIVQSFEPDEDWLYCFDDDLVFGVEELQASPSHPPGWSPGPPWMVAR
jgi:uncharacterized UBP type Zn finger protein